jgi:hypothetical protein
VKRNIKLKGKGKGKGKGKEKKYGWKLLIARETSRCDHMRWINIGCERFNFKTILCKIKISNFIFDK